MINTETDVTFETMPVVKNLQSDYSFYSSSKVDLVNVQYFTKWHFDVKLGRKMIKKCFLMLQLTVS